MGAKFLVIEMYTQLRPDLVTIGHYHAGKDVIGQRAPSDR
jgi:hypothetical protein